MFQHQGIWLPDGEKHFPEWMTKNGEIVDGKGTYQIRKLREALTVVRQFRVAVDCGAHIGTWAMHLAKRFREVEAFEPMAPFRACFEKNVTHENVCLHRYPLGDADRNVNMAYNPADSGDTHVSGSGDMKMRTLDSFEFEEVDFIKVDVEGYEDKVLLGAMDTIERCRPVIIVEQKAKKLGVNFGISGTPAVDLLQSIGMRIHRVMSGDYIMVFR